MVEKRNFVAEAGCTSGCDSHLLGGVRFLDDSLRPTLDHSLGVIILELITTCHQSSHHLSFFGKMSKSSWLSKVNPLSEKTRMLQRPSDFS